MNEENELNLKERDLTNGWTKEKVYANQGKGKNEKKQKKNIQNSK